MMKRNEKRSEQKRSEQKQSEQKKQDNPKSWEESISFFHGSNQEESSSIEFQCWDTPTYMNSIKRSFFEDLISCLRDKQWTVEKDIWSVFLCACSTFQGMDPIHWTGSTDEIQRWKRDIYHEYSKEHVARKKAGETKHSLKTIQTWCVKSIFDTESERLQYLQWLSTLWNIPLLIIDYDTLSTKYFTQETSVAITSWKDIPCTFVTDIKKWSHWSVHIPILLCVYSQGRYMTLPSMNMLPPEIAYMYWMDS